MDASSYVEDIDENNYSQLKFPTKLWRIINNNDTGAIRWGNFGKTILIDNNLFQAEYLDCPSPVFKTRNISSFVRQLNMYGFRKMQMHQKNMPGNSNNIHKFYNKNFQYGRPDLLTNVKRRIVQIKKTPDAAMERQWVPMSFERARKRFEDILLGTPEFVEFWKIMNQSPETKLNSNVIEPKYQLTIIPLSHAKLFDNQTIVAEVSGDFQHLISSTDLYEPNESEDDEETDDGYDLESYELAIPSPTNDEECAFKPLITNDEFSDITITTEIINDYPIDLPDEENLYDSLAKSFTII